MAGRVYQYSGFPSKVRSQRSMGGRAEVGSEERDSMASGSVKWFSDEKGYGFIVPDDGSKDLFVHHSNILGEGFKSLSEGQRVSFEAAEGRKGPEATSVSPE